MSTFCFYSTLYQSFYTYQLDNKKVCLEKKEVKLLLFTEDIIFHIGNPKESTSKLLELIDLARWQDTRLNVQKAIIFLYTNNQLCENEIKETITFETASKG